MTDLSVWWLFQSALVAGVLHCFDADHIAAIAGLSSHQQKTQRWSLFSIKWAAGHGVALMMVAVAVIALGMAIPYKMSEIAEQAVAYTLIVIGLLALAQLYAETKGVRTHTQGSNKAAMVGLLHGCAGSAPLLAILPAAAIQSPFWGLSYVLLFCFIIVLVMVFIGRMIVLSMVNLDLRMKAAVFVVRFILATCSLLMGVYLLVFT